MTDSVELQHYWDRLLVEAFYKAPDVCMSRLVHQMMADMGIDYKTLNQLKRVPRRAMHMGMTISRFCCGYIPRLGPILWKYNKDNIEYVIGVLDKWTQSSIEKGKGGDTAAFPLDKDKDKELKDEERRAKVKLNASSINKEIGRIHRLNSARSGWGVCKPTNVRGLRRR